MNFHDNGKKENRKIVFIRFSTLRIFHESGIKIEGGKEVCISLVGPEPKVYNLLKNIWLIWNNYWRDKYKKNHT